MLFPSESHKQSGIVMACVPIPVGILSGSLYYSAIPSVPTSARHVDSSLSYQRPIEVHKRIVVLYEPPLFIRSANRKRPLE
jgi:hypothetical protein